MPAPGEDTRPAVMESFFSTVQFELGEHVDSCGEA
jgi:hypothetical protein